MAQPLRPAEAVADDDVITAQRCGAQCTGEMLQKLAEGLIITTKDHVHEHDMTTVTWTTCTTSTSSLTRLSIASAIPLHVAMLKEAHASVPFQGCNDGES